MSDPRPEFDWMSALDLTRAEDRLFRLRSTLLAGFALVCGVAFVFQAIPLSSLLVLLSCLAVAAVASWMTLFFSRRRRFRPSCAFIYNTIDVTAITGIMVASMFTESPHTAALGPAHVAYFLVIIGSATRFHAASTIYASVLASAQYAAVAAWVRGHPGTAAHSVAHDLVHPGSIAIRVAVILAAGGVTVLFIRRVRDAILVSQASQKLHARVVNEISDGLLVCDTAGRIVEANAAASELLGVARSVLLNLDAATVLPDPLWSTLHARWAEVLTDGVATAEGIPIPRDGGPSRFVDVDARCVRVQDERIVRIVLRDVTAEQSLWEKDSHFKRLAAMRKLATSISHEFNNILSTIESSAFVLSESIASDSPQQEEVKTIRGAADRATALVREIADLTDTRRPGGTPIQVLHLVDKSLALGKRGGNDGVSVRVDVPSGVLNVVGDEAQIVRALGKVIGAAYGAMLDGGKLAITARNLRVTTRTKDLAAGEYVAIEVSDTGIGMPADAAERAFDPFHSVEAARWTGFGLAGARAVVARHGGTLDLRSAIGRGTTYTITLPATRESSASTVAGDGQEPSAGRGARLLVVDDDPGSRRSLARVLATRGYEIYLAEDGKAALDLCEREKGRFDLVLLDMVMPGLSGRDVLAALRARFPSIKVLVVTGDSDEAVADEAIQLGAAGVTHKPFDVLHLFEMVRTLTTPAAR